jgi:nonsense-mediated mRNA decay protein 3
MLIFGTAFPSSSMPTNKRQEQEQARMEQDYEMFLRDVEEDQELRQTLDLRFKRQLRALDFLLRT